jgi:tetratricopeptide (TPR) repeat protein
MNILEGVARKAKEYFDQLPQDARTDLRLREQSVTLNNLGDVLNGQGKLEEALDAYQQSLAIRRNLAEQYKSDAGWQRDLSVSYNRVGDVLSGQGKLQEALDVYQQSLSIRQKLAEQDKSNAGWQRDLSVSYEKVDDVLRRQKMGMGNAVGANADVIVQRVATNRQRSVAEERARLADEQMTPEQKARVHKARYIVVDTVREKDSVGAKSLMIYDTQTQQVIGDNVYDVKAAPKPGQVSKFDTFDAEYVGTGA